MTDIIETWRGSARCMLAENLKEIKKYIVSNNIIMKKPILTSSAPEPIGPYNQAVHSKI